MPTYTVQINVNVPSFGDKTFTQTGIVANSIELAIAQVKANIIVTALAAQQTAS